jgi:hypothetical protein
LVAVVGQSPLPKPTDTPQVQAYKHHFLDLLVFHSNMGHPSLAIALAMQHRQTQQF